ncbi:MAG: TIGR03936 family radical SAM-associated protein [Caldisericia bacterium]|nr:TIGR03936 family radical SAM-associated protein [Caldisericia bacterium]
MTRIRVEYIKNGIFIFLSNLDMIRYIERVLRRSELPINFTSGFNPKPKMDFSPAIPLGIPSESEIFDFYLNHDVQIEEIFNNLKKGIDKDLIIKRIKKVNLNSKSISSLITHFEIELIGEVFKNLDLGKFRIKKERGGNINYLDLGELIFLQEESNLGKKLILNKNFSLRDLYENLKFYTKEKIFIRKLRNLKFENDKIIDIFDLE